MQKPVSRANGITEGVIWKQLLLFSLPIMLGSLFQQLYSTVDAVIVGRFVNKAALAAVGGSTGAIIDLLIGLFNGISSGATVIIAQYFGARKPHETRRAIHTALAIALAGGAALTVIGIAAAPYALDFVKVTAQVRPYALDYLYIYFGGVVFSLLYNVGAGILRAMGDSKRPLYFLVVCCGVNILLDILFVALLGMEVRGAALATVFSQGVSAALVLASLKRVQGMHIRLRSVHFDGAMTKSIIYLGVPAALQSAFYAVSNMIVQSGINGFGTDAAAAWTACSKFDGAYWMIINAFGVGVTTFVGQNFGAEKYGRVRQCVKWSLLICTVLTVSISVGLCLSGQYALRLFSKEDEIVALGVQMIYDLVPFYFTFICVEVFSGALRGAGDAIVPTLITVVGICVLRAVWILVILPMYPSIPMVEYCYPVSWSVASVCFVLYYRFGGWMPRCVEKAKRRAAAAKQG